MKIKKQNKRVPLIILSLTIILFIGYLHPTSVKGFEWIFEDKEKVAQEEQLTKEDIALIEEMYNTIQVNYIDDVDKKTLLEGAFKGMVGSLEDPYSEFLNPSEQTTFDDSVDGSFNGIGVQFMIREGKPTVIAPIDGTPASEAGIQANDVIISADDVELEGLTTSEIIDLIRGPEGSEVKLTIQRGSSTFDVKIKRAEIPLTTVEAELDKEHPKVGYLKISQFASTTYEEMVTSIKELRDQGAERFIFDFRYNPGGLLDSALAITNMFMEDRQILMQTEDKLSGVTTYEASDDEYGKFQVEEPYVLLVDEGSASASEILAVAIKENTNHDVIGTNTFGKGTVQTLATSSEYGELKLTIAKWLSPKGEWIHDQGVKPDKVVEQPAVASAIMLDTTTELKEGDASEFVQSASLMLDALGFDLSETSYFDQKMEQAVKDFQKKNKLKVSGIIDGETAQILMDKTREYIDKNDPQYKAAMDTVLGE